MKMNGPFSDNKVKGFKPADKDYTATYNGLSLKVYRSGRKVWFYAYRDPVTKKAGKKLTIGEYPFVSLAQANQAVLDAKGLLSIGRDPHVAKLAAKQKLLDTLSFTCGKLLEQWLKDHKTGDRTKSDYRKTALTHFAPGLKTPEEISRSKRERIYRDFTNVPVIDVRRSDIKSLFAFMISEGIGRQANLLHTILKMMFDYAEDEGYIEETPVGNLKKPAVTNKRKRHLSDDEIRILWRGLEKVPTWRTRSVIRLELLLARRGTEICSMKWDEIDFENKVWLIPNKRTTPDGQTIPSGLKIHWNRMHEVDGLLLPLSDMAVEILQDVRSRHKLNWYVFPSEYDPLLKPMKGYAASRLLKRNWKKFGLEEHVSPHDMRRSAETGLAMLGVREDIISRITAHSQGDITDTYNHYKYVEERRAALNLWGEHIRKIVCKD